MIMGQAFVRESFEIFRANCRELRPRHERSME
jgi:hypothetical protein